MKFIWCSGLPEIYAWLEGGQSAQGICALCYIWNLCDVVVFHGSMVNWRRGWSQSVMKIIRCNGLPEIHARLRGGGHLPKGARLPNMNTLRNLLLLHRGLFYERPMKLFILYYVSQGNRCRKNSSQQRWSWQNGSYHTWFEITRIKWFLLWTATCLFTAILIDNLSANNEG